MSDARITQILSIPAVIAEPGAARVTSQSMEVMAEAPTTTARVSAQYIMVMVARKARPKPSPQVIG